MAAGHVILDQEVAPSADAYGRVGMYFASSSHVVTSFQQVFSTVPSGCPDVGLLVAGIGMAPATFVMPEGALAAAGYGAVEAVPVNVPLTARQPRPTGTDGEVVPFKGPWTKEEDDILKDLVRRYGDRKWAAIADHLPDRIGKQCRERWTNHLRPDLVKKDIWTEHDDRVLIEGHKIYGNRWSAIARYLPGRSENAVKNHWNATKRSLKSKRRFKKKKSEQAAPGQFTLLEEYIRSQPPATVGATVTEPTAPSPQPQPSSILGHYGCPGIIPFASAQPAPGSSLPGMGMYIDNDNDNDDNDNDNESSPARSSMNLNMPALPDLNTYGAAETQERCYHTIPFGCGPSCNLHYGGGYRGLLQMTINGGDTQQAAYTNLNLFPFAEKLGSDVVADQLECQSYGGGYYSDAAGPSSAGGSSDPDDIDVVQMASREFLTPSEDEVTLDLTRFK